MKRNTNASLHELPGLVQRYVTAALDANSECWIGYQHHEILNDVVNSRQRQQSSATAGVLSTLVTVVEVEVSGAGGRRRRPRDPGTISRTVQTTIGHHSPANSLTFQVLPI